MEESHSFPVVKVSGSHYEIGFQVGTKCKDIVQAALNNFKSKVEKRIAWKRIVLETKKYLPYAEDFCPELLEEVKGCAEGAQVSFEEYFALYCSDTISDVIPWSASSTIPNACTDIAVSGELTSDRSVLVGHNNDSTGEEFTFLLDAKPNNKPRFFAVVHGGVFPTIGFNSAGISITGNHLTPTDMRIGVPLGFTVRKVLSAESIGKAMEFALPEKRASSYNQVVSSADGEIYSLEGSATDFEAIYAINGYIVHTNHYVTEKMKKFEKNVNKTFHSIVRYNRALKLLKKGIDNRNISIDYFKKILTDHVNFPYSICRHKSGEVNGAGEIKTIYSAIIDLTHLTLWLCRGNPCEGEYKEYRMTEM
ncbi:MAG: C45 family peptidase [Candidatus Bathyarchaeia archaeon]